MSLHQRREESLSQLTRNGPEMLYFKLARNSVQTFLHDGQTNLSLRVEYTVLVKDIPTAASATLCTHYILTMINQCSSWGQ